MKNVKEVNLLSSEFKFLSINTRWEWEEVVDGNNYLDVDVDGVTLARKLSYVLEKKLLESGDYSIVDLAIDKCGVIYLLYSKKDSKKDVIYKYDSINDIVEQLEYIGGEGSLPGQFNGPQGIAINNETLFVTDADNNRIQSFAKINQQIRWIVENPVANIQIDKIAAVDNDIIYVLVDKGLVYHFNIAENEVEEVSFDESFNNPTNIAIDKNNYFYVYEKDLNQILRFENDENDPFLKKIHIDTFNLDNWGINPAGIAIDPDGNIYAFKQDGEIDILKLKSDQYFIKNENIDDGNLKSEFIKEFDSDEPQCKWHKIIIDAEIPDKTQINVSYQASDEKIGIIEEKEWEEIGSFNASYFKNTTDLKFCDALIHNGTGRYLRIKLELISTDEYNSPKVKSIKVFYPRNSYLRYLPAIYQEDQASKEFLERFLSLFETFSFNIENEIDKIARYFDAKATPVEFLSWLGAWIATIFDETWSEGKKRQFLMRAIELYKMRGTREGIEEIVKIYTGSEPIIVESWQLYETNDAGEYRLKCQDNEDEYLLFNLEDIPDESEPQKPQKIISQFKGLRKLIVKELDNTWSESKISRDKNLISIEKDDKTKISPQISLNPQQKDNILKIDDCRTYELKFDDKSGNVYLKNSFERLFGEPTPFSFCLLLAPYLFSFNALDVMDDLQINLNFEKLKEELQIKNIFLSENSEISAINGDAGKISDLWIIRDEEVLRVVKEGEKIYIYRPPENIADSQIKTVRRIIDLEKPAHTVGGVVVLHPWIYLDMHTYLGINTFLMKPVMRLEMSSVIGRDTALSDTESSGQIETRARIGMDTKLS